MAGFVLAAFFIGFMKRFYGSSRAGLFLSFLGADAIILCSGAVWLGVLTGYDPVKLLQIGVLPFVPGGAAAAVYKALRPRLEKLLY